MVTNTTRMYLGHGIDLTVKAHYGYHIPHRAGATVGWVLEDVEYAFAGASSVALGELLPHVHWHRTKQGTMEELRERLIEALNNLYVEAGT